MPAFFIDTPDILPLPSLQAYTSVSLLLVSCSLYYAFQVTYEPDWAVNATLSVGVTVNSDTKNLTHPDGALPIGLAGHANETSYNLGLLLMNPIIMRLIDVIYVMFTEPLCIWTLINMAYCCLILVGKIIQKVVFGELRVSEQQHIKDRFWNFVFYKFIFIFGVMNVQYMDDVVLWCSWFSILGFLSLLAQLCKDRFEYLSFSPMTPKWTHVRLLLLLLAILACSLSLFIVCVLVGIHSGINTFAFMFAECALVAVRTLFVIIRYSIHLWDLNYDGVWENRASYAYYTELLFELATLTIDFCHHLHMLFWGNIILSMASLVILMQLRYLFYEIKRRIRKHKNYLQVVRLMEANFPMATQDELEKNSDDCAICWDHMDSARKLPCGHLFHNSCLRSWLEQDTSCPTCRTSLKNRSDEEEENHEGNVDNRDNRGVGNGRTNHFFHFDGSRYASWLPSVSVEVTRPHLINIGMGPLITDQNENATNSRSTFQTSQIDGMARQVQDLFPQVPMAAIVDDLRVTRSIDLTIDNILDERISINTQSTAPSRLTSEVLLPPSASPSQSSFSSPSPSSSSSSLLFPLGTESSQLNNCDLDLTDDDEHFDEARSFLGNRFSKSSHEREKMLQRRKEVLLKEAKRSFMLKQRRPALELQSPKPSTSTSVDNESHNY